MEIAGAIVSKIAECTVESAIRQGRYLFRFNGIVVDLNEGETNLRSKRERMVSRVKSAEDNNENIYEDVKKWLNDSSIILGDVQRLNAEIEEKRSCLNGWCCRYCLSRKAVKKTSIMLKRVDEYDKIEVVGEPAPLPGVEFSAPKDCELFRSSKAAFDQIIEALRNEEIDLIGLYGMGGSGKTTLAKKLAIEVKERGIFNEVVMVVVSQAPNFKDMQIKLARSLGVELKEEDEEERAKQLYLRFTKTNTDGKKKSLVILDDVWKKFDLKSKIGFPFGEDNKHCKILVTTRRQRLCAALGCQSQISLGLLNEDEGLTLLKRYADINEDRITSELEALAIQVARECKGLPLAITTIGRALKERSIEEWKLVFEKLKKSKLVDVYDVLDVDDEDVYACLKLSYDYLRDKDTKFCFLLCSLFPEDYEIYEEELVACGTGLGLFSDADLMEDARSRLRVMLNSLKDSCLLLAWGEECVKMHDMVRDVALWIASKGNNVFMSKHGMGSTAWSKEKGWEQYTAMSLLSNKIEELPVDLVCPKLEILLLGGRKYFKKLKISDECFKGMKALIVLCLEDANLSLKSLQSLPNLKTLKLIDCTLRDIFYLEKLNELEILYLRSSSLVELPRELSKLRKLRWLSIDRPGEELMRIPSNLMRGCCQLEELYISEKFKKWEIEEKCEEKSNASLFELNSLSRLVSLRLQIDARYIPKDFAFPRLQRHDIRVNNTRYGPSSYRRILKISDIEATSLTAFKALYGTLEYLLLDKTTSCQNILPGIDRGGLNELKSLTLMYCKDLKCIVDTSQQSVPSGAFTNLVELSLDNLMLMREICSGGRLPKGFLEKLETMRVYSCSDICSLFPTELLLRLHKLENVEISSCM